MIGPAGFQQAPKAKPEPVRLPNGDVQNFTLRVAGKPFRCGCGCNVLHKPDNTRPDLYECNSCGNQYD